MGHTLSFSMNTIFKGTLSKIATPFILVGIFGLLWIFFAPIQSGGKVAYVIISGNSMEPNYHLGDLVVARERSSYQIGDIVVYRHPEQGHVFHRIIDQEEERFILKGDNNSWNDFHHPYQDEIVGKLWLHVPFGGSIIGFLRSPANLAILTVLVMVIVTAPTKQKLSRKSKRKKNKKLKNGYHKPNSSSSSKFEGLIVFGAFALGALILGIIAFIRPVERVVDDSKEYQHIGILIYHAPDSQDVYDTDEIKTGEPIFLQLACDVQLIYSYHFSSSNLPSAAADQLFGSYRVTAQVSDPNGWNRTIGLTSLTEFTGPSFTAGMDLDLCQVRDLIVQMEEKTGTHNNWYDLTIFPDVFIFGSVLDRYIEDTFAPQIQFEIDEYLMRLPRSHEAVGLESLTPTQSGTLPGLRMTHNSLNVFGLAVPIMSARWISSVAFAVSMAGVFVNSWPLFKSWKSGNASRIRIQYNPMLVDVEPGCLSTNGQVVLVGSFEDLIKLANRYGAMILSENNGRKTKYYVQDGGVMYAYVLDSTDADLILPGAKSLRQALLHALEFDEFQLYYQPIVSTEDNQIIAAEALIRWFHPERGLIYPAEFISIAEEHGLMEMIDNWVIEQACQQLNAWTDNSVFPVMISVNVSPQRFVQEDFADWLSETIQMTGCDPKFLQLEINRANTICGEETAVKHFRKLKELDVRLAIDNFTASSSNQVDSITRLPLNTLKIDRTLINQIFTSPEDTRLVSAVVKMVQSLELHVVAEGVETPDQMAFLREHNIAATQGYLTGYPMPADEMTLMLIEGLDTGVDINEDQ